MKMHNHVSSVYRILWIIICLLLLIILFVMISNRQTITFPSISGPLTNPLMGWAPWATGKNINQPHTLVYADLTWRELEPSEGGFDFQSFEERNNLCEWRMAGKRVIFRFLMDVPRDEEHFDIPEWLYLIIGSTGTHYENTYGKGYSPDYNNPILIEAHQKAIKAIGDRYGQDDFFAYIEIGSLGHWGEWHVKSDSNITPLPPEEIRDQYVKHYIDAFPNTHLLMRRPFNIVKEMDLGLFNDMTAHDEATRTWLGWINEGGEFSQTDEKNALAAVPETWKTAPIGGEQTGSINNTEIYHHQLEKTVQLLQESHVTFIGPRGPYELASGGPLQNGIDRVLSSIGYRLRVEKITLPKRSYLGKTIHAELTFTNDGVAPIYYPWPLAFYLLDSQGIVQIQILKDDNLSTLLPGEFLNIPISLPIDALDDGMFTIALAIIDPLSGQPAVKFAMENMRDDNIQPLASFELNRLFQ
jgi:hypothetical protein